MRISGIAVNHLYAIPMSWFRADLRRPEAIRFAVGASPWATESSVAQRMSSPIGGTSHVPLASPSSNSSSGVGIKPVMRIGHKNGEQHKTKVPAGKTLQEHKRFALWHIEKYEVPMIFEAGQSGGKVENGIGIVIDRRRRRTSGLRCGT